MRPEKEAPAEWIGGTLQDRLGGTINRQHTANRTRRQALARRRWQRPSATDRAQLAAVAEAELAAFDGDIAALLGDLITRLESV